MGTSKLNVSMIDLADKLLIDRICIPLVRTESERLKLDTRIKVESSVIFTDNGKPETGFQVR
jgi:hypothetical protein